MSCTTISGCNYNSFSTPGQAAGFVGGGADIPAAWSGTTPSYRRGYHPPLPGMEAYYPPETDPPFELDNSSESLTGV